MSARPEYKSIMIIQDRSWRFCEAHLANLAEEGLFVQVGAMAEHMAGRSDCPDGWSYSLTFGG